MVERVRIDHEDWWYYDGTLYKRRSDIGGGMAAGFGAGLGLFWLAFAIPWYFLSKWPVPTLLVALATRFDCGCDLLLWYAGKVNHIEDPLSVCIALTGLGLFLGLQHGVNSLVSSATRPAQGA